MASSTASNAGRTTKKRTFEYTEPVQVTFGKAGKQLLVHEDVLCSSSLFLKTACSSEWRKSKRAGIKVPEVESDVFAIYVNWLYTADIHAYEPVDNGLTFDEVSDHATEAFQTILRCYLLGDFLDDRRFRNAVIDELINASKALGYDPAYGDVKDYFSELPETSKMRRVLVDFEAPYLDLESLKSYPSCYTTFIAEAGLEQKHKSLQERRPRKQRRCYYHEHVDESDECE